MVSNERDGKIYVKQHGLPHQAHANNGTTGVLKISSYWHWTHASRDLGGLKTKHLSNRWRNLDTSYPNKHIWIIRDSGGGAMSKLSANSPLLVLWTR